MKEGELLYIKAVYTESDVPGNMKRLVTTDQGTVVWASEDEIIIPVMEDEYEANS